MEITHKTILTLSISLMAGYTWSLDMPQALEVPLRQDPFNFTNFDFSLLYFATYIPVCFFDVTIGMILDRISFKKAAIWITSICLVSEVGILITFYLRFNGYKIVLYFLRGIFGATGSGLFTVQALLITRYGGKYYDTLIGIGVCIPFFFDSVNNVMTPLIYERTGSMQVVWLNGVGFCLLSLISSLLISIFVNHQEKDNKIVNKQQSQIIEQKQESFSFRGLKQMRKQFWIIIGAILLFQLSIASYIDNLNDTLVKRFQFSYVTAGFFLFMPYGLAAVCSYILSKDLNQNPKRKRKIILFGAISFSIGILVCYLLPNIEPSEKPPQYYYFVVGLQFITISLMMSILYGCLSASIKYVVKQQHLGIGWGVIGSTIGLSEALGPIVAAFVLQTSQNLGDGYKRLTLSVFIISLIAVQFSLWIFYGSFQKIDTVSQGYLCQRGSEGLILE